VTLVTDLVKMKCYALTKGNNHRLQTPKAMHKVLEK
jgi:hypothetical protein